MNKNLYKNNENEFEDIKKILKNLPKISAPENFEFNLETRIQNKSFDLNDLVQKTNWLAWGLGPITALALSIVVFFAVIRDSNLDSDNLFLHSPQLINSSNTTLEEISGKNIANNKIGINEKIVSNKLKAIIQPNDVVVQKTSPFPFNKNNSLNLDDYINGGNVSGQSNGNFQIVNSSPSGVNFNGFGIPVKTNAKQLKAMRNKIDSLHSKQSGK